jgi:hypothetical protein
LNERLQAYQVKAIGATPKLSSSTKKEKQHFIPHDSDTTEFRNTVVGVITLSVQAAFYLSESLDEVMAVLPKWSLWLSHLAEKGILKIKKTRP